MKRTLPAFHDIAYICLYASNFYESITFYGDVLGLKPTRSKTDGENFFSFRVGATHLGIEKNGVRKKGVKTKAENPILLQFKANSKEELEALNKRLEEKGVKLFDRSKTTHYGIITSFCDPDGNKLEIIFQE